MLGVIDQDVASQTDANGNATIDAHVPSPTMWAALKATIQTSGSSARWSIQVAGVAKAFGRGDRIDLPFLVQPAQPVKIVVQNAAGNQPVTGKIHGPSGSTFEEVAPFVSLAASSISVDVANVLVPLLQQPGDTGIYIINDAALHTLTFPLPPGAQVVRLVTVFAIGGSVTTYRLTGNVTPLSMGTYVDRGGASLVTGPKFDDSVRLLAADTAVQLQVQLAGGAGVVFMIQANTGLSDIVLDGPNSGTVTVQEGTAPPAWQRPNARTVFSASIANGGVATLIAGVAGQVVSLHSFTISADGANAAGVLSLQDTAATPANIDVYYMNATRTVYAVGDYKGLPLTSGLGVQAVNGGAAPEFFGIALRYVQQ